MQKEFVYTTKINKPVPFVFEKMMDNSIYSEWATPWGEGMTYSGEWTVGSYIIFHDDKGGTKALIVDIQPNEAIKMKHVAMVDQNGEELEPSDEAMKKWIGSLEEYSFMEENADSTTLKVVMNMDDMFQEMSEGAWPKALALFKDICER